MHKNHGVKSMSIFSFITSKLCIEQPASRPPVDNDRVRLAPRRSINEPISRLLGASIGPVAADLFLLRRLDRRHIGPRHAGVAPLVPGVVLAVGHHVLGPIWIVLQEWNGADAGAAG